MPRRAAAIDKTAITANPALPNVRTMHECILEVVEATSYRCQCMLPGGELPDSTLSRARRGRGSRHEGSHVQR